MEDWRKLGMIFQLKNYVNFFFLFVTTDQKFN